MGVACCSSSQFDESGSDLAAPILVGKKRYQEFELNLPFARTHVNFFVKAVDAAHDSLAHKRFVTIESLRNQLTTPAWADLDKKDSALVKMLSSNAFKREGQKPAEIDVVYLTIMGMLNCVGTQKDKALVLFTLLQPGGPEKNPNISANDKDLDDVFPKIVKLATVELFELAATIARVEIPFTSMELNKMRAGITDFRENKFLEDVFGTESLLTWQAFVNHTATKSRYMCDPEELRREFFKSVGVDEPLT